MTASAESGTGMNGELITGMLNAATDKTDR